MDFRQSLFHGILRSITRVPVLFMDHESFADRPEEERFRLQVIRSTWIVHGRELIYDATLTNTAYKFERILHSDVEAWRKKVIELGCWYVRVAAETMDTDFKVAVGKEAFLSPLYSLHN
jgi:hypothetical protein